MRLLFLIWMLCEWFIPAAALLGWLTWERVRDRSDRSEQDEPDGRGRA
jgi:hypothetical protein